MDPLCDEGKLLDGSKKMDPLCGEETLLDISRKLGLIFSFGEQLLLANSREKKDLLSTKEEQIIYNTSSDEDFHDGLRNMTRDELIKYITQVVESEGFDVDPLPADINMFGLLIPLEIDECLGIPEEVARFAINHNSNTEGSTKLKLDRVIKYNEQDLDGCKSYVTFTATDINTGGTHAYQAKVTGAFCDEERSVNIFRRKYHQQFGKEEEIRFLTIFAINYHRRTTGQDLELVKGIVYDQHDDSYIITFKARDLSSCMTEIYQAEVVSTDPIENSTVIFFKKCPDPSAYQALEYAELSGAKSGTSCDEYVWGNSGKDGAGPFNPEQQDIAEEKV